jgi:uncharacterized protein YeaC (DUF1315 family)
MPMKITIEFYRTRDLDDAHAVLGRVSREAYDLDDAVEVARTLLSTLEMPQWPDAMTISDAEGKELCRRAISHRDRARSPAKRRAILSRPKVIDMDSLRRRSCANDATG